jgi:hypothetical protein
MPKPPARPRVAPRPGPVGGGPFSREKGNGGVPVMSTPAVVGRVGDGTCGVGAEVGVPGGRAMGAAVGRPVGCFSTSRPCSLRGWIEEAPSGGSFDGGAVEGMPGGWDTACTGGSNLGDTGRRRARPRRRKYCREPRASSSSPQGTSSSIAYR